MYVLRHTWHPMTNFLRRVDGMAPDMPHDPLPRVRSKFYWGVLEMGWSSAGGHIHINLFGMCRFSGYRFSA